MTSSQPWARFETTPDDRWDVPKVAHLHRGAGFGAAWRELHRDVAAGPQVSIDRLLNPLQRQADEERVEESLRRGALTSQDPERLKTWWLYRMLWGPDPLREKLTL